MVQRLKYRLWNKKTLYIKLSEMQQCRKNQLQWNNYTSVIMVLKEKEKLSLCLTKMKNFKI